MSWRLRQKRGSAVATESVSVQMKELLETFSKEVQEVTDEEMRAGAEEAVQKLRATSPKRSSPGGRPGRYARGWRFKKDGFNGYVVYNATDWQLTHLLENGHRIGNQFGEFGRVNGIKHIKPVEEWAQETIPLRISRGIK